MQLSKTTEYAIKALIYLEKHTGVQRLDNIAGNLNISEGYLIKVLRMLKQRRVVSAHQGAKGGYELGIPAKEITLYEVMCITERSMNISDSMDEENGGRWGIQKVYMDLQKSIEKKLSDITLKELADDTRTGELA